MVTKKWVTTVLVATIGLSVVLAYYYHCRPERIWAELWGRPPPNHLTVVNAERHSGENFAGEWAVFFEIKPSRKYLELQKDSRETLPLTISLPEDAPDWFLLDGSISNMRVLDCSDSNARLFVFLHKEDPLEHSAYIFVANPK